VMEKTSRKPCPRRMYISLSGVLVDQAASMII